jgi:hypothetical protein
LQQLGDALCGDGQIVKVGEWTLVHVREWRVGVAREDGLELL